MVIHCTAPIMYFIPQKKFYAALPLCHAHFHRLDYIVCTVRPLAIAALLLYPPFWLITLPVRLLGIAVGGVFHFLKAIINAARSLIAAHLIKKISAGCRSFGRRWLSPPKE
jgi:hypothetical protein